MEENGIKQIVPSHGDIIFGLFFKKRETMKQVAERIQRDKSTITTLVNKLILLDLVQKEKDEFDHRINWITLTEKGKQLKPLFFEISDKLISKVYSGITPEDREKLIEILLKVNANFI